MFPVNKNNGKGLVGPLKTKHVKSLIFLKLIMLYSYYTIFTHVILLESEVSIRMLILLFTIVISIKLATFMILQLLIFKDSAPNNFPENIIPDSG